MQQDILNRYFWGLNHLQAVSAIEIKIKNMDFNKLYDKALRLEFLTLEEGMALYEHAPTPELMFVANQIRQKLNPNNKVGWIIDRNVNITNVCISKCKFCNFYVAPQSDKSYTTTIDQYEEKIEGMLKLGGRQLLMQGGHSPYLGIDFYTDIFSKLKAKYPSVKLHALGPPEVAHIARKARLGFKETLEKLIASGMDSLPGAGAEILSDRVRKTLSPGKCDSKAWLDVMREAHKLNITTSATMMFGHIETHQERIEHLISLREVQAEKPDYSNGFTTFIAWPYQDEDTELKTMEGIGYSETVEEYIRIVALSRIMMPNIKNIQASWLTVGKVGGQIALHAGANDFGSIMIEENVVSAAGANYSFNAETIQQAIREAGFEPQYRNQRYEPDMVPEDALVSL